MKQLVAALMMMFPFAAGACMPGACGMGHASHGTGDHASHASEAKAPKDMRTVPDPNFDAARTRRVLEAYDRIVVVLADDQVMGVGESAALIVQDAPTDAIKKAAEPLAVADGGRDVVNAREQFKALSAAVVSYVAANRESFGTALEKGKAPMPRKAYCPMAEAAWLQRGEKITNPYYGKNMLRCGSFQSWETGADGVDGSKEPGEAVQYVCPMHSDVRQDQPGECPRCGMTLKPVKEGTTEHPNKH